MKKLGLLFIISFSSLAWGQTYNLELDIEMGKTPGGHSTSFYGLVEYVLTDGTKGNFVFIDGTYGTIKKNITLSKPIREMHLYSRRDRGGRKICGGDRTWFVRDKNLPCADLKNEFYTAYTNSCLVHNSKMTVKAFKITPNLELPWPGAGNNFTEDKVLTLTAPGGFPSFVYTWEYSSNNGATFQPIPGVIQKRNRVHILGSHFLDKSDHGKTIYFRINYGCDYSKSIPYKYIVSAPRFLRLTPNLTTCYDTNNGSVKIYLDRALKAGEQLSIASTNDDFPSSDFVNLITSNFDKNNSIVVPGLKPGNYAIQVFGYYNGAITYVEDLTHKASFTISKPAPVEFTTKYTDINCFGGSDGTITITGTGGTGTYKYQINGSAFRAFSNGKTHILSGLAIGTYTIKIQDSKGCESLKIKRDSNGKIIGSQGELKRTISIDEQPDAPLVIKFVYHKEPTALGFSNGRIRAQITGGTPLANNKYNYTWVLENGTTRTKWTTFSDQITSDGWFLTLENAIAGTYKLTITDANHAKATDKTGCTIIDAEFTLKEPPLLKLSITVTNPVSCNNGNTFGNTSNDGELTVTAEGGVPFDPLINGQHAYKYTWKKKDLSGVYRVINGEISKVLSNIDTGDYAVNIEDANGIIIGTYRNNTLVTATDRLYTLNQPQLLQITLNKVDVLCNTGNDATATVYIAGGIPPYSIQWSNGQNTATAINLIAGNHIVLVTDARGCQATGSILIDQPGGLMLSVLEETHPTCFQGGDGKIELELSGGAAPYTYSWNTGATTTGIDNLPEGTYIFSLTDANGCTAFKEIVLQHPNKSGIDLGEDRTLCKDQTLELDGSIADANATYIWTSDNGFSATKAQISVTEAGIYEVIATSQLGCTTKGSIVISYNNIEIDAEFLLSSQAYVNQDIILFNVSSPLGETSQWVLPNNVTTVTQTKTSITLRFPEVDTYQIGFISRQGNCYQEILKNIVVEEGSGLADPGDTALLFIEEFKLTPNPNNGSFKLYIDLAESSPIAIRVFTIQGGSVFVLPNLATAEKYTIPLSLTLPSGMYFVVLETAKQTQVKRMIVN